MLHFFGYKRIFRISAGIRKTLRGRENNFTKVKQKTPEKGVFGWGGRIRTSEMAGPKPAALPLGDAPLSFTLL